MRKSIKIILISIVFVMVLFFVLLITTGKKRMDVYLKSFEITNDSIITLNVGVASSSGYIRKMEKVTGSDNLHLVFYSTYGINNKIGSLNSFELELDNNVNEIYFYIGDNKYKRVLVKDKLTGKWRIDESNEVHNELNDLDYVSMFIKKGTLTNVGATIIIDGLRECGDYYRIDKFKDGKWSELNTIIDDYSWNYPLYSSNEKGLIELNINWEWLYGTLESGKYRLVKEYNNSYYSVEFIIDFK